VNPFRSVPTRLLLSLWLIATPFLISASCNQNPAPTPPTSYSLNINKTGPGTITSSPAGISCGESCASTFAVGASVTLTATPGTDASFTGWDSDCSGTANTCTVKIDSTKLVKATFTQNTPNNPQATFTVTPTYQNNAYFIAQGANGLFEAKITNRSGGFVTAANQFDSVTATGSAIGTGAGKLQLEYRKDLSSADTLNFVLAASSSLAVGAYDITLEATAGSVKASVNARVEVTPCSFGCQ
jgi:Divergent InlB B-repeat domain